MFYKHHFKVVLIEEQYVNPEFETRVVYLYVYVYEMNNLKRKRD